MHHTLLPEPIHRELSAQYRRRVGIVLCLALLIALVIGFISLMPAYVETYIYSDSGYVSPASLENLESVRAVTSELSLSAQNLNALEKISVLDSFGDEIERIDTLRGNISITHYLGSRSADGAVAVILQGTAPTRDDLLSFEKRLSGNDGEYEVDLPISALAKSTNLQFSMKIIKKINP